MKKKKMTQLFLFLIAGQIFFVFACRQDSSNKGVFDGIFPRSKKQSEISSQPIYSDSELKELGKEVKKVEEAVDKIIAKILYKKQLFRRIGDRCLELGLYHEAYDSYEKALQIDSGDETLHYKSAVVCAAYQKENRGKGDSVLNYRNAEAHYLKAIQIRPQYQEALTGLATLYHFEMSRPLEALELLHAFRSSERPTPQLLMTRAAIYRFLMQYEAQSGAPFAGSSSLLKKINRKRGEDGLPPGRWELFAREDYQNVIDRFGSVEAVELQNLVQTAKRLQQSLNGPQTKD